MYIELNDRISRESAICGSFGGLKKWVVFFVLEN